MSSHAQSTFRFCKCANATRPMRRLLLSGLPLVLTTRYFGMTRRAYVVTGNFQPVSASTRRSIGEWSKWDERHGRRSREERSSAAGAAKIQDGYGVRKT